MANAAEDAGMKRSVSADSKTSATTQHDGVALYDDHNCLRVVNNLKRKGIVVDMQGRTGDKIPQELLENDAIGWFLNYGGSAQVRRIAAFMEPAFKKNEADTAMRPVIIDMGAGFGAPARLLGSLLPKCDILGVEVLPQVAQVASTLTRLSESQNVRVVAKDIMDVSASDLVPGHAKTQASAMMAILSVVHVPSTIRDKMWEHVASLLRPGAVLYMEDFFQRREFTEHEEALLLNNVGCDGLLNTDAIRTSLLASGFEKVQVTDCTQEWTQFVSSRAASWSKSEKEQTSLHGADIFSKLKVFYDSMDTLFTKGGLGGFRVSAIRSA